MHYSRRSCCLSLAILIFLIAVSLNVGSSRLWGGESEAGGRQSPMEAAQADSSRRLNYRFATKLQATEQLQAEDEFLSALSRFDLQVRLKTQREPTIEQLKQRIAQSTLDWQQDEIAKLNLVFDELQPKFEKWKIPWPETIWLIKSTGDEDADAPYTRGTSIVFPLRKLRDERGDFAGLIVHELFHILSRQNKEFRRHMYAVIGFHLCPEIPVPRSLEKRKITNPDAPRWDCYQTIRQQGEEFAVTPVIYSRNDFDERVGGNLFSSLEFRLMRLEPAGKGWKPAEGRGESWLLNPRNVPDFHAQIGRNTKYIIHPDEILADNFVHLILEAKEIPSPEIVKGMTHIIRRPGA